MAALQAYTPGLQPGEPGWIKLNTNENPYPPSPRVAEALRREIGEDGASLRLYPNPEERAAARGRRAGCTGCAADHVFIGNGADDVLNLLVRCFCAPAAAAGFTLPSYSLYPVLVGIQDGRALALDFDRSMRLPVDAIAASAAQRFLPHLAQRADRGRFPHGGHRGDPAPFPRAAGGGRDLCGCLPRRTRRGLVARHPNLCVVRTLSKSHCLAGMRVGYALAHPEVIGLLDRVKDSYNVSRLSQAAALAALDDPDYYAALVAEDQGDARPRLRRRGRPSSAGSPIPRRPTSSSPSRGTAPAAPARRWPGGFTTSSLPARSSSATSGATP